MAPPAPVVQISAHGPASATTRLWRYRGQLRVTVIAKATLTLVHQAMMKLAPPDAIVTADVHHGDNPVRSVRVANDLAPYLPGTDVIVAGHAHAPPGTSAQWVTAGVALYDKYDRTFEKYLDVRGNMGPGGITPFAKMPLLYERAFGGPGWEDNPFGVGVGGAKAQPNIFYIGDQGRSAGFGPLSPHWPARRKLISNETRKAIARPIAEIPEGFDWTYFHATPPDQRCAFLQGSEWVVLQGLRPNERRVRSRLPAVRGRAVVFWAGEEPAGEPLELIADTLQIDADRGVCSLTWRKSFAVAEASQLPDLRITAGVQLGEQPIRWPAPSTESMPRGRRAPMVIADPSTASTTITLSDSDLELASTGTSRVHAASIRDRSGAGDVPPANDDSGAGQLSLPHDDSGARDAPPAVPSPDPAPSPRPMVLGAFRLAVFSPEYQDDPDDPLLSTLVIRDKPSLPIDDESLAKTLVLRSRRAPGGDDDSLAATQVLRARRALMGEDDPLATTRSLPVASQAPPKILGLAGTLVMDDNDDGSRTIVTKRLPPKGPAAAAPPAGAAAPASATPPARPFPKPDGVRMDLIDHAALAAALAESGAERDAILSAHGISEADWSEDEKQWKEIRRSALRGDSDLIAAFDSAYVTAWESIRGPFSIPEYACLSLAAERGDLPAMLATLKLTRATWRRVVRVWARRMAEDPAFAMAVRNAESALR